MSSINQLSTVDAFSGAMQLPVYDAGNGQPRKASGAQLLAYIRGNLTSDASGPFTLFSATVAELAANYPAASYPGAAVYCTNGNAGAACLAVSDGTAWRRIALGSAVSAT